LCFPRRRTAACVARRPKTTSCASMMCQLRTASPAFGLYVRTLLPTFFSMINYGAFVKRRGVRVPASGSGVKIVRKPCNLVIKYRLWALIDRPILAKDQKAIETTCKPAVMGNRDYCPLISTQRIFQGLSTG